VGVVAWAVIGLGLLTYWGYHFLIYPIRVIFGPLVISMIIVYLLNPLVSRMERHHIARIWGALITYLVFITAVAVGLAYLIPVISEQVKELVRNGPTLVQDTQRSVQNLLTRLGLHVQVADIFKEIQRTRPSALSFLGHLTSYTRGAIHIAIIAILGPILGFYVLVDVPKLSRAVHAAIPEKRRGEFELLGTKISAAIGGFFRGQLVVAVTVGLGAMFALYLVGLPFWAVIGLLVGLFNLVPMIGPYIGAFIAVFVGFTATSSNGGVFFNPKPGWELALASLVALIIVQQLDSHIVSPNVVGRTVKLHPVTVMLSLLAGGTLLGLWGMLLAVPTVAVAKILLLYWWDTRVHWPPEETVATADGPTSDGLAPKGSAPDGSAAAAQDASQGETAATGSNGSGATAPEGSSRRGGIGSRLGVGRRRRRGAA
jgi:predicted PurR-regulated permease PerM